MLRLQNFDVAAFLRDHWQQTPLLIRDALPGFASPLSPGVNARLIQERGPERPWQVNYGPFTDDDFTTLPATHWTLLVSDVEKHVPDLYDVVEAFRFIPDWRIDDLMISYAPTGGSVGAHIDDYDVFLLQAAGHRHWMISDAPVQDERYIEGLELRILQEFTPQQAWTLGPGDLLYLPPRYAHHGVATDDACMTYSIGFRAPSRRELATSFAEYLVQQLPSRERYTDPALQPGRNPGLIDAAAFERARALVGHTLAFSDTQLRHWFGRFVTEPKGDHAALLFDNDTLTRDAFKQELKNGTELLRSHAARLAWCEADDGLVLFADGQDYPLPASERGFVERLCLEHAYAADFARDAIRRQPALETLHALYRAGILAFADDFE